MSDRLCAQLVAWGSAWLAGAAAFDDVLDAVALEVRHYAGPGFGSAGLHPVGAALTDWKRAGTPALRLALPVPGDVRGLVGQTEFRAIALATGEAVFGNGFGITLEYGAPTPSSAGREVIWHRGEVGAYLPDAVSIAEADHDLAEAIRDTASLFSQRGTSTWLPNIASALSGARRAGEELHLPSNHPPRAVRLIAQAERLSIVLRVVDSDDTGELSATAMQDRVAALAPLRTTVRRGLLAGYNAAAEVASE